MTRVTRCLPCHPSCLRPWFTPSEIRGRGCLVAVPIFYGSIFGFEEAKKTAVRAIFEQVAPYFDGTPWFDGLTRDADIFKAGATRGLEGPNLRLALGILNFQVDPGMRNHKVHFFDNALQIHK